MQERKNINLHGMRGSISLFTQIFAENETCVEKQRKGRSATLNERRNELLINRYYYYGKKNLRYDEILDILSVEFFLSAVTIPKVIDANFHILAALKKENPSPAQQKKKWPHLIW